MGELADEAIDHLLEWGYSDWWDYAAPAPNMRYDRQLGYNTQRPAILQQGRVAKMFEPIE